MHACKLLHSGYHARAAVNKLKDLYPQFAYVEMDQIVHAAQSCQTAALLIAQLPRDVAHARDVAPKIVRG